MSGGLQRSTGLMGFRTGAFQAVRWTGPMYDVWQGTSWTSDNLIPHTSATGGFDVYIYPLSERDPETMTKATQ